MLERYTPYFKENDPFSRLETRLFGTLLPSPLIVGSGSLIERFEQIDPFLRSGAGAVVPRTTRKVMERQKHPSPHLYQAGTRGNEKMLNAEWTGADITYWRPYLEKASETQQVIMSVSGRDITGCVEVCKELDAYNFPYLEVNVSCAHSNSQHGFITRNGDHIQKLVSSIKDAGVQTPVAIKLGHSDFIVELAAIAKEAGADGIVVINSYGPVFDFRINSGGEPERVLGIAESKGGMTGAPIFEIALTDVAEIKRQVDLPVIGCGGVRTAEHVVKMMMAGASAVQIYTAAHVKGTQAPSVFSDINRKLVKYLDTIGTREISEVKGKALPLLESKTQLEPLIPKVISEKCTGCDICIPVCLPDAITIVPQENKRGHIVEVQNDACIGCGHCVAVCPTDALRIDTR